MSSPPQIKALHWSKARDIIAGLDPELFHLIDSINPDKRFVCYRIRYPFGASILKQGTFYLPDGTQQLLPISDTDLPKAVRADLHYNLGSNPVLMPIRRNAEVYLEAGRMIIPYRKLEPGHLLGAWGVLDKLCPDMSFYHPEYIWNMNAGMRSIFMLPKVGDKTFHQRLQQEYGITEPAPKHLNDQWRVFKAIVDHHQSADDWSFELLCFSKAWFEQAGDPAWVPFYHYLLQLSWCSSSYLRNQSFWDLVLSVVRKAQKISPSAYINDIIKHLYATACGSALGFAPAVSNGDAPIDLLQDAYVNGMYKLKDYLPVMMTPHQFNGQRPVYFSLHHVTTLEFSERSTKRSSFVNDITRLSEALQLYLRGLERCGMKIDNTEFYRNIMETQFDCFYDGDIDSAAVRPIQALYDEDQTFSKVGIKTENTQFPQRGHFLKSCLRVSSKQ